jgi:uncharacterized protein (TIRG00374 family)
MTPAARKRWFNFLRVAICIAALAYVARGVSLSDRVFLLDGTVVHGRATESADAVSVRTPAGELHSIPSDRLARDSDGAPRIEYGLRTAWHRSNTTLLWLAVVLHFPVGFLQANRIKILLAAQRIALSWWQCVKLSFAGNFLNFAAPLGSNAGDVFKAYFVSLHTPRRTEAVTTVLLDRIIGLGTLLLVVALIAVFSPPSSRLRPFRNYVLLILALAVVAAIVYLSPALRRMISRWNLPRRIPGFEHLVRVDEATRTLAARPVTVLFAVLFTAALQALAMAAYFTVAVALGMKADAGNMLEYYAYFATGAVIQALPGPPQGLGTVELAYRYFLAPFGSPSQIVCFALAARLVVLTCALPGVLVTLTGAYRPNATESALRLSASQNPDSKDSPRVSPAGRS